MRYRIGCNIIDVINQVSFAYHDIISKIKVFVLPLIEATRAFDFIRILEEKQEVWHKMMTIPMVSSRYYKNFYCPSLFRSSSSKPSLLSQLETFFCH